MTSRRNFLTGAASLMALAVSPSLGALTKRENASLAAQIKAGRVEGRVFLLTDPEPIVVEEGSLPVIIERCAFVWQTPATGPLFIFRAGHDGESSISGCLFDGGGDGRVPVSERTRLAGEWVRTHPGTSERYDVESKMAGVDVRRMHSHTVNWDSSAHKRVH
jgi:hypothetical protein